VGKTALAIGLGIRALEAGHRISFVACHDLVTRFRRAQRADRTDRLLTTMLWPKLLILDEIGYTPLERPEATFLFAIVAKTRGYKKFCVRGVAGGEKEEMRISRKKFAVVGAVGAVENGGGAPFSTTPQPSIDRPSSVELQTNRATRSLRSPGGAERSY
jgi:hypothetical protein